jgi:hypothetical protein
MTILANDSPVSLRVTLTNPRPTFDGRSIACRGGEYDEPRVQRLPSTGASMRGARSGEWLPITGLTRDAESCSFEFIVEPGFAALLDNSGRCDQAGDIESLVIETMGRRSEWRGSELAEGFERRSGLCVHVFREP